MAVEQNDLNLASEKLREHLAEILKYSQIYAVGFWQLHRNDLWKAAGRFGTWLSSQADKHLNNHQGPGDGTTGSGAGGTRSEPRSRPISPSKPPASHYQTEAPAGLFSLKNIPPEDASKFVRNIGKYDGYPLWQVAVNLEINRLHLEVLIKEQAPGIASIKDGNLIVDKKLWDEWPMRKYLEAKNTTPIMTPTIIELDPKSREAINPTPEVVVEKSIKTSVFEDVSESKIKRFVLRLSELNGKTLWFASQELRIDQKSLKLLIEELGVGIVSLYMGKLVVIDKAWDEWGLKNGLLLEVDFKKEQAAQAKKRKRRTKGRKIGKVERAIEDELDEQDRAARIVNYLSRFGGLKGSIA